MHHQDGRQSKVKKRIKDLVADFREPPGFQKTPRRDLIARGMQAKMNLSRNDSSKLLRVFTM
jgi:hypothetical protein